MARQRSNKIIGGETFYALPGTARNFADGNGRVYSRRTIDAMAAGKKTRRQAVPLTPGRGAKQSRKQQAGAYKLAVNAWKKAESERRGVSRDKIKVRGNSDEAKAFQAHWKAIKNSPNQQVAFNDFLRSRTDKGDGGGRYADIVAAFFPDEV